MFINEDGDIKHCQQTCVRCSHGLDVACSCQNSYWNLVANVEVMGGGALKELMSFLRNLINSHGTGLVLSRA